ncbi:hypothetical protein OD754_10780 [Rhodobacter capsulatus]|uniref:AAA family ATPase n=1 Tax=Rhodobacter capsulatus TaxID=1061 RepID=UPI0028742B9F|nr:AAA family ATPase [Rhodobacter capsulatus]MDS0927308.1 hypothetical protein [Rhodobacter capsulatus]UYE93254.1 hypothetical protein Jorvik_05 [Rhodobacter phage Jorvik]
MKASTVPRLPRDFPTSCVAVWGMRGSGKSTLGRELIRKARFDRLDPRPQIVRVDPVGAGGCTTARQVEQALKEGRPEVDFTSSREDLAREVIALCLARSRKWAPIYLVLDEASVYLRRLDPMISKMFLQGRHYGLGVMMISQRPVHVHPDYRSQAVARFWLRLDEARDRSVAAEALGRDVAARLQSLPVGQFIQHPTAI